MPRTWMRRGFHGGSSKYISKINIFPNERKMKYLFKLNFGSTTMDEYEKRFSKLLKYIDFIMDEKVKIQMFVSGLPSFYSDKIQYDNPNTLEKTIRRSRHLYEKIKGRSVFKKNWNDKMKGKREKR
jgi:hypothetical protein